MLVFYLAQFALRPWRGLKALRRMISRRPNTWFERALSAQIRRAVSGRFVPETRKQAPRRPAEQAEAA